MHPIRSLLLKSLKGLTKGRRPLALLLSGGCDSVAIAICLKELGLSFKGHTYYFSPAEEQNKDIMVARKIAAYLKIPCKEYSFDETECIERSAMLRNSGVVNRADVQTMVGLIQIFDALPEHCIISGEGADHALWGSVKSIYLRDGAHSNPKVFLKLRQGYLKRTLLGKAKDIIALQQYAKRNGSVISFPYTYPGLVEWFHARSFKELKTCEDGKRRDKGQWYDAFRHDLPPELLSLVRRRCQEVESGVRDFDRTFKKWRR